MTQSPKWRVWFADETIRGADGATQTRAWVSDFERSGTIPVIELAAAKELVDALKEILEQDGTPPEFVVEDCHRITSEALAKLPAEVLGED